MIDDKKSKYGYLLVSLAVAYSGFPYFTAGKYDILIGFAITLLIFVHSHKKYSDIIIYTIIILVTLVIAQTISTKLFDINVTTSLLIKWTFVYLIVRYVGLGFINKYIKIIYYLSIISLILYFSILCMPSIESKILKPISIVFNRKKDSEFYQYYPNIILYCLNIHESINNSILRNCGPFWEPGAFSGFVNLALIFNLISDNKIFNKKNIIFSITVLSTMSVAGIMAYLVLITGYLLIIRKSILGYLIIPLLIISANITFNKIDMFSYKINTAIESLYSDNNNYYTSKTRTMSAILDIRDIQKSPICGTGRIHKARYGTENESIYTHRNNGVTDFIVKYGVPFAILYYFSIFKIISKYSYCKTKNYYYGYIGLLTILIFGFAENYFQSPIFISLYYLAYEKV